MNMEIDRKNAAHPDRARHFVRACAVETHMDISQRPFCMDIYRKMVDPHPGHGILCEPAQSKCTWTFRKSHSVLTFPTKKQGTGLAPIPGTAFCASLRSRNARGHFTRAILCGNHCKFRGKNTKKSGLPGEHLDKTPGLYCYRKNPFSVATLFG